MCHHHTSLYTTAIAEVTKVSSIHLCLMCLKICNTCFLLVSNLCPDLNPVMYGWAVSVHTPHTQPMQSVTLLHDPNHHLTCRKVEIIATLFVLV